MIFMNSFMAWKGFKMNGHSFYQELTVTTSAQNHVEEDGGPCAYVLSPGCDCCCTHFLAG
jgi:hypothetical protein